MYYVDCALKLCTRGIYNIARVLPYLIPIGVIMVHFSTDIRTAVHPSDDVCKLYTEACARSMRSVQGRSKAPSHMDSESTLLFARAGKVFK